jgi:predicted ATPase
MNQRETIEQAIRALEAEREKLGDVVVDVTVDALREMQAQLSPTETADSPEAASSHQEIPAPDLSGWGLATIETSLVGRDEALDHLHQLFDQATNEAGRMVTIVGEAGMGKSRLAFEFGQQVRQQASEVLILRARADHGLRSFPYALARDLLTNTLDIQDNQPAAEVVEKLVALLRRVRIDEADLYRQAALLGQLAGLGVLETATAVAPVDLQNSDSNTDYLRQHAFAAWSNLVEQALSQKRATLIFLEDLHLADVESLFLLAHVRPILSRLPVLLVCLAQSGLYERWPHWPQLDHTHTLSLPHTRFDLSPLPATACRQLVRNMLQPVARHVPQPPEGLVELVVTQAQGNPFFVEEMVKTFIDDGLIVETEAGWRVQAHELPGLRVPGTLVEVLQGRLNRLSSLERITLQRASVMGHTFWETAVLTMNDSGQTGQTSEDIRVALSALEERGLVFRQAKSLFAGTDAYMFKHNLLQQVVYESIRQRQRSLYHTQVANWLSTQSGERVAEYAGKIAAHYQLGGEAVLAAGLYELAGRRAQNMSDVELAIDNYRQALALITDKLRHSHWLLRLQETMGPLLLRRLRLVEAAQVYMTMQYTADIDGELALQAKAWLGLASAQQEQGDYSGMQHSAQRAHRAARLVTAQAEEAQALLGQSEASIYLGRINQAQERAQEALKASRSVALLSEQAQALSLLFQIHHSRGEMAQATALRQQLENLVPALHTDEGTAKVTAFYHLVLAGVYRAANEWLPAYNSLERAYALYGDLDQQLALAPAEAELGRVAYQQDKSDEAVTRLQRAVALAEMSGDEYGRIRYQFYLAQALLAETRADEAEPVLAWLLDRIHNEHLMVDWWGRIPVYELLVQLYLAHQEPELALNAARQAQDLAHKRDRQRDNAVAWRLLAQALQAVGSHEVTVSVHNQHYDVPGCLARSWQHLESANSQVPGHRQRAWRTLQVWRTHEAQSRRPAEVDAIFAEREAALLAMPTWNELYLPRFE